MEALKQKKYLRGLALDFGADVLGSLLFAIGIVSFTEPANIAPGGVSGIAIILNYLWDVLPIGGLSIAINVPLMILSFKYLGRRASVKTICSLIISSLMIDWIAAPFFPVYSGDRLLGAVFGGVFMGAGLALIFLRGSTTGGTEIVSNLMRLRWPHISMGRAILFVDCAVIAASIVVFGNLESGMYGIISLFCTTKVIDTIVYGFDQGNMVTVVSDQYEEISRRILEEIDRGVTLLHGKGAYTGQEKEVLICAVRKSEFSRLKSIVREVDHSAFVVTTEAGEIFGEGFKPVNKD
ncbi:MAG TPA: YitT family protein [Candidatus Scybalocola faecigallinarum]|uniref:YitT family protein n=1 Tax=Candidatus Scybalocola faecigallinarum TaxID=2840941 RepID=A0A9D1JQD6_9FIRM|nr:YitT family protein [Candidatus Scybalocola faecigallinarum]